MTLDPKKLRAAALADLARAESAGAARGGLGTALDELNGARPLDESRPLRRGAVERREPAPASYSPEVLVDVLQQLVAVQETTRAEVGEVADRQQRLTRAVKRARRHAVPAGGEGLPDWLVAVVADRETYSGADPARKFVGWRVVPSTIARLKLAKDLLGMKTHAGTLECVLRLGLAVAERLPTNTRKG